MMAGRPHLEDSNALITSPNFFHISSKQCTENIVHNIFRDLLRLLPAGATVAGRDSHPQGDGTFPRCAKTLKSRLLAHDNTFLFDLTQQPNKNYALLF